MLDRTFNAVFDGLNEQYKPELEAVRVQYPFQDLRYRCPCLRFKYAEAMALLREKGPPKLRARLDGMADESAKKKLEARIESVANHADTEDIGTEDEKLLGEIVAEVHGQDFYIIDKFPSNVRPFYTMPDPVDPNFSNSYASGRASDPAAGPRLLLTPPHPIPPSLQVRHLHPRRGGHLGRPADPRPADAAGARRGDGAARRPHADPGVRRLVQVRRLPPRRRRHRVGARRDALPRPPQHPQVVDVPARPAPADAVERRGISFEDIYLLRAAPAARSQDARHARRVRQAANEKRAEEIAARASELR